MTSERLCAGQPSARAPRTALQNAGCGSDPQAAPGGGTCAIAQLPPRIAASHGTAPIIVVFFIVGPDSSTSTGSLRPQVFQHLTHLRYLVGMRWIAQRFLERIGIPLSQSAGAQEVARVCRSRSIEGEAIGLDPKGDRRIEGVDGGECVTGEERTTEAAQTVVPKSAEAGEIVLEPCRNFLEPYAQTATHRTTAAQFAESGMHFRRRAPRPRPRARGDRPDAGVPLGQVFRDGKRIPNHGVAVDQARDFAAGRDLTVALPTRFLCERHQVFPKLDLELAHQRPRP